LKFEFKRVIIQKLVDGVFYSSLICERDQIEEIIDSRTSDAYLTSFAFSCTYFCSRKCSPKSSCVIDDNSLDKQTTNETKEKDDLHHLSVDELQARIQKALKREEYELAVKLRDEIAEA
jgi:bifunctional DNase/RNase